MSVLVKEIMLYHRQIKCIATDREQVEEIRRLGFHDLFCLKYFCVFILHVGVAFSGLSAGLLSQQSSSFLAGSPGAR